MVSIQYRLTGRNAKEISDGLEAALRTGGLAPGDPLPSVRTLATELNVAAGTVAAAYKLLRDRGLVEARGRRGTFVRPRPPVTPRSAAVPISAHVIDLASGQPASDLLPELGAPAMIGPAAAPAETVLPELRELAGRRLAADGVPAGSTTLAGGGLDSIGRLLAAQLRPGDIVAVEDPGWPNVLDLVATLGLRVRPVGLDEHGPRPEALQLALRAGARAVIVTNRAQNPTGGYLTPERADQLRRVLADHPRTLVVEDDHAAELAGVELASLAGATDTWAFVRSMSKPYGPDLRVAVIAGDEATIARVEGRLRVSSGWVSTLLQRAVLELWTSPEAAASVARAARTYDARRRQLITQLDELGIASTGSTGLNVWVPVADETATVASLLQAGWAVAPGARFRQVSQPGIRITVSALDERAIPRLATDLARALALKPGTAYTT